MATTIPPTSPAPRGAPAPPGTPPDRKAERRREKREKQLRRDAERRPESWERLRILQEVVDEQRNVVEIADHKARYALLILGVLNAVIFVLLGRGGVFARLPAALEPWMLGLLTLYAALTLVFVYHAIDCLRPRAILRRDRALPGPGLLYWEGILRHDAGGYQQRWTTVRMDQLTGEAAMVAFHVAHIIDAKYRALRRLYAGLAALVFLCTALLAAYAAWGSVP